MKYSFVLFCCLLVTVSSTKISLEDIERDNINSEKRVKAQKSVAISRLPHPSPSHYGFIPMKTPPEYLQQPPVRYLYDEQQYYLSQGRHLTQTERPPAGYQPPQQNKYITQQVKYVPQAAVQPQKYVTQYVVPQVQIQPPQYSPLGQKEPKQYTQLTPPAPPSRPQIQPQQYSSPPHQQYTPLSPLSQFQSNPDQLYRQQPNVQYITDNSIAQPQRETQKQQYYNTPPQFYYLQQSPSDNIQSVIDPKGGVQYVMYVPTYVPVGAQSQNYENVVYVTPEYAAQEQDEQVTQQQQEQVQEEQPQQPQHQQQPTQYVLEYPSEKQVEESKPQIIIPQVRREPKSLLDSYIPSYLQIQYYKQQEHRARDNSVIQDLKAPPPPSGKSTPVKGRYRTINAQRAASSLVYNYRLPAYRTYVTQ